MILNLERETHKPISRKFYAQEGLRGGNTHYLYVDFLAEVFSCILFHLILTIPHFPDRKLRLREFR
jgi:hypothetical protein